MKVPRCRPRVAPVAGADPASGVPAGKTELLAGRLGPAASDSVVAGSLSRTDRRDRPIGSVQRVLDQSPDERVTERVVAEALKQLPLLKSPVEHTPFDEEVG